MKHVLVIGGGIIGLSSAYFLRQAGHRVTVIDKGDFTDNCSYGNAGYVCPGHFIPLATPGIVWKGLKWMMNAQSPFYVQPSVSRSLADWGFHFIRSANHKKVEAAAVPLRDIAALSQREYQAWAALPDFDFGYEQKGLLEIFKTSQVAAHAHHVVEKGNALGLDVALLDAPALQQMEPHTKINALGAIFFKGDSHLYPNKLMKALLTKLKQQGVQLLPGEEVTGFEKEKSRIKKVITSVQAHEADEVVIAGGAWSRTIAAWADTKIPMMPGRGYSLTLEDSPYRLNHPAIFMEGRVAITPMDGNKIRFGGTMEVVRTTAAPRYERVKGILKAVKDFFPEFDMALPAPEKLWYGYRPCSADGLPYIGRISRYENVVMATGHAMLGLSRGAGTGRLVCELVDEKKSSIDLHPFRVERFGK